MNSGKHLSEYHLEQIVHLILDLILEVIYLSS